MFWTGLDDRVMGLKDIRLYAGLVHDGCACQSFGRQTYAHCPSEAVEGRRCQVEGCECPGVGWVVAGGWDMGGCENVRFFAVYCCKGDELDDAFA